MALLPNQRELFDTYFTGGLGGSGYYNIVYDEDTNMIYVCDDNGVGVDDNVCGSPNPSIDGNISSFEYEVGTVLFKFRGRDTYPYAEYYNTENQNYKPASIRIINPLTISGDDGSNSGEIHIETQNSQGTITYSIEPAAGQQSGASFYNLPAGDYLVLVSDEHGSDELTVRVPESKSYGTMLALDYKDRHDRRTVVYINKKEYSGDIVYPDVTGNPVVLNYPGSEDKFNPIFGSELNVNLWSKTNYQWLNLFSDESNEYIFEYYKESELLWKGKLFADNYSETYSRPPYPVTLVAVDGLANLRNKKFLDTLGNRLYGRVNLTRIICYLLEKTGLGLDVWFSFPWYYHQMDESWVAMEHMFIDLHYLYENDNVPSCYEVLEELLISFNLRIYQRKGHYEISNVLKLKDDIVKYFVYGVNGNFKYETHLVNHKIYNDGASMHGSFSFVFIENDMLLEVIRAYAEVSTYFKPLLKPIIGSDFTQSDIWKDENRLYEWKNNLDISKTTFNENGDFALLINGCSNSYFSSKYMVSTVSLPNSTNESFELNLKVELVSGRSDVKPTGKIILNLELVTTSTKYTYYNGEWHEQNWGAIEIEPESVNSILEVKEIISGLPYPGELNLNLLEYVKDVNNNDYVTGMRVYHIKLDNIETSTVREVSQTIELGDYDKVPESHKLKIADAPVHDLSGLIYKRMLLLSDGTPTIGKWDGENNIQDIITTQLMNSYDKPTHKITGSMSGNFDFGNVLYDQQNPNKYFVLGKLRIEDKKQMAGCEWVQVETSVEGGSGNLTVDSTEYTADDTNITADQTVE